VFSKRYLGRNCQTATDYCVGHECANGSTCVAGDGGYSCNCVDTTTSGTKCENQHCTTGVCGGGNNLCNDTDVGYSCGCIPGWEGADCEGGPNAIFEQMLTDYIINPVEAQAAHGPITGWGCYRCYRSDRVEDQYTSCHKQT